MYSCDRCSQCCLWSTKDLITVEFCMKITRCYTVLKMYHPFREFLWIHIFIKERSALIRAKSNARTTLLHMYWKWKKDYCSKGFGVCRVQDCIKCRLKNYWDGEIQCVACEDPLPGISVNIAVIWPLADMRFSCQKMRRIVLVMNVEPICHMEVKHWKAL